MMQDNLHYYYNMQQYAMHVCVTIKCDGCLNQLKTEFYC